VSDAELVEIGKPGLPGAAHEAKTAGGLGRAIDAGSSGNGNISREVAGALAANGVDVRALSRLLRPRAAGEGRRRAAAELDQPAPGEFRSNTGQGVPLVGRPVALMAASVAESVAESGAV
jgi:hypothetical protein